MFNVGDTKEVDLGALGVHTLRIANVSTPSECLQSGFSQTACGIVLEFADIITTQGMNSTQSNVGGWPTKSMRTYINNDIYNALPTVLKDAIIDTSVVSGHESGVANNYTSNDKLYLLSSVEVYGSNISSDSLTTSNTRQLDYYDDISVTSSSYAGAIKQYNESDASWWLRSAASNNQTSFMAVNNNGSSTVYTANTAYGVSPAFRIGSQFREDTWEMIVANADSGDTSMYTVGDTKQIDLGTLGVHTIRVANNSMPNACLDGTFSETACGFVLEFADIISLQKHRTNTVNSGGWRRSDLRTYVNDTVYNAMPTVLREAILNTSVIGGYSYSDDHYVSYTIDKLYLLSTMEVYGGDDWNYDRANSTYTRQLDYYSSIGTSISTHAYGAAKKNGLTDTSWWLRSAFYESGNTKNYTYVTYLGARSNEMATAAYGVSPAFRLGKRKLLDTFETDSWTTIISNVNAGNTYVIGSTKTVDMGSLGTHTLRVANNTTPAKCSNTGFSQTACGFVLEFADVIENHVMKSTDTNVGGWPASEMRTYLNSTIYNALPAVLRNAIIDTYVVSGHGTTSGEENFVSTDKLYLLSAMDILGNYGSNNNEQGGTLTTSVARKLDYYSGNRPGTASDTAYYQKKLNGTAVIWWTRTAYYNNDMSFTVINAEGTSYASNYASLGKGVSPAFRIGITGRYISLSQHENVWG